MKLIVVVDKNWGIGKGNDLLFRLKEDMRHFVAHTLNKTVVMGNNTLKSLPGGKPLKNRVNIVLGAPAADGYIAAADLGGLFKLLKDYGTDDVYVIGGAMTYKTLLEYCDTAYVTRVDADGHADVFFENLDKLGGWECAERGRPVFDNGYEVRFCVYKNKAPKAIE